MKFTKMQGAGNDFIVINNMELNISVEKLPGIARKVCERCVSVGGNALMVVDHPERGGNFQMRFYNADGSLGEMCGNGARCIARYGYENKIAGETMTIETGAGDVFAWKMDKRKYKIKLNNPTVIQLQQHIVIDGKEYLYSYTELGNPGLPHAVVRLEGFSAMEESELFQLGKEIRNDAGFPKGVNVNFCEVIGENEIRIKTFERGVEDFTLACGTGAGSTAMILTMLGLVERDKTVKVHAPGGILFVDIDFNKNTENKDADSVTNLYLVGDTNIVSIGEITDEDLEC